MQAIPRGHRHCPTCRRSSARQDPRGQGKAYRSPEAIYPARNPKTMCTSRPQTVVAQESQRPAHSTAPTATALGGRPPRPANIAQGESRYQRTPKPWKPRQRQAVPRSHRDCPTAADATTHQDPWRQKQSVSVPRGLQFCRGSQSRQPHGPTGQTKACRSPPRHRISLQCKARTQRT